MLQVTERRCVAAAAVVAGLVGVRAAGVTVEEGAVVAVAAGAIEVSCKALMSAENARRMLFCVCAILLKPFSSTEQQQMAFAWWL
jgi:hypothetical protein